MTILDYLLLGGFAAALCYTGYRLFIGWLRTPSHESTTKYRIAQAESAEGALSGVGDDSGEYILRPPENNVG